MQYAVVEPTPIVALGEVADLQTGFPFRSDLFTDDPSDPRLLRGDNVAQGHLRWDGSKHYPSRLASEVGAFGLRRGDVILAMDRPWIEAGLKYAVVTEADLPCLLVQRVARLRGSRRLDAGYLRYVIGSRSFTNYILGVQTGTAVPHISGDQIREFPFPLPPLPEQRAIASVLGSLDDKIDLNRRMNATLDATAQAIFKAWFVDFEALPEQAGQWKPMAMVAEGSPACGGARSYRAAPQVPPGWQMTSLGDRLSTALGGTPSRGEPRYWRGGTIPWINSGKANELRVISHSELITEAGLRESATKLLPKRTTIVAITGATLGQVSLLEIDACANQSVVGILPSDAIPPEYVYLWVKENIDHLVAKQTGGAQQHVNTNDVKALPLLVPSREVLRAFGRVARPIFDEIAGNSFESETLAALRDTLLPKLLSGEVRIKDVL